jgi:hypothetical protein
MSVLMVEISRCLFSAGCCQGDHLQARPVYPRSPNMLAAGSIAWTIALVLYPAGAASLARSECVVCERTSDSRATLNSHVVRPPVDLAHVESQPADFPGLRVRSARLPCRSYPADGFLRSERW